MRFELALLTAAAVIFAPGWQAPITSSSSSGVELAGRILAPTFDEASAASPADRVAYERLEGTHGVSSKALAWYAASALPPVQHIQLALAVVLLLALVAVTPATRSPRAPPHPITV
jgi:hypothetical protein